MTLLLRKEPHMAALVVVMVGAQAEAEAARVALLAEAEPAIAEPMWAALLVEGSGSHYRNACLPRTGRRHR